MSLAFAVPFVALTVAYIISADSSQTKKASNKNPLEEFQEGFVSSNSTESNNLATSRYLNQNEFEQHNGTGGEIRKIYSLTGKTIDPNDFKHQNMVPFYGGKIKGQVYGMSNSESILDQKTGGGSQLFHKTEQAPLFSPENNMQWAYGTPNSNDFIQSRINASLLENNVRPFQQETVGPGLNKGFSSEGSDGYNSGLNARETYMPKNVDDLRVATNPKSVGIIEDYQGPSASLVKNIGTIGRVEKNRPDTFYIQTQDRWLTTTGAEKGQTLRGEIELFDTARNQQSKEYVGVAGRADNVGNYAPRNFKNPKKEGYASDHLQPASAMNQGQEVINKFNQQKSIKNYSNNRSTTRAVESFGSGFTTAIGAVIAPLMDIVNPTRRQETTSNLRIYGDAGSSVPENYILNPKDKPVTTIKETTLFTPPIGIPNASQHSKGAYGIVEQQALKNQRATTSTEYFGDAGGATKWGVVCNQAAKNQHNNDLKEPSLMGRINHGNMAIYNEPSLNFSLSKTDCDTNPRLWVPTNMPTQSVSKDMLYETRIPLTTNSEALNRNEPDILNAFRQNPYTQSLSSVA
jgi:Family of unknown function (DUF5899)